MDVAEFKKLPILGIIRGIEAKYIESLTECVISSGLKTVEITMNTIGAPDLIQQMIETAERNLTIGAGTVLNLNELHQALDAGASFIVLPTLVPDVVDYCAKNSIPVFPGALTPQEIYDAWNAGATMVKVFPSSIFGPTYFKEIKGPFNDVELMACGGVNSGNIKAFFNYGASAVAFGGSIFNHDRITKGDFSKIENDIKELIKNGGLA